MGIIKKLFLSMMIPMLSLANQLIKDPLLDEKEIIIEEESDFTEQTQPNIITGKSLFYINGGLIRIEKSKRIGTQAPKIKATGGEDKERREDTSIQTESKGTE